MTRPRIPRNIGGDESGTDRAGHLASHRLAAEAPRRSERDRQVVGIVIRGAPPDEVDRMRPRSQPAIEVRGERGSGSIGRNGECGSIQPCGVGELSHPPTRIPEQDL